MQITIQCPQCGAKLKAKDTLAGHQLPCPKCGHTLVVSLPETEEAALVCEESLVELPNEDAADSTAHFGDLDLGSVELGNLGLGDFESTGLETANFGNA